MSQYPTFGDKYQAFWAPGSTREQLFVEDHVQEGSNPETIYDLLDSPITSQTQFIRLGQTSVNSVAYDDLAAAVAAIPSGGKVHLGRSVETLDQEIILDINKVLVGQGASFNEPSLTKILCTTSDARLVFEDNGGESGGFLLDGNNISTLPLLRRGYAANRIFKGLYVINSAEDNWKIIESQNDLIEACGSQLAARDNLVLDEGCGGLQFVKFSSNEAGRHGLYVVETTGLGPYTKPSHISFYHSIFERTTGASNYPVKLEDGSSLFFITCAFDRDDDADSCFKVMTGVDCVISDSILIVDGGGSPSGFDVDSGGFVTLHGRMSYAGVDVALGGSGAYRDFSLPNIGAGVDYGTGTDVYSQRYSGIRYRSVDETRSILFSQLIDELTGSRFNIRADGQLEWNDGTDFTGDILLLRWAANLLSLANGDSFRVQGTWDGGHFHMGNYHLWVDATGDLRIKSSAPASDLDGTVVGSQS